MKQVWYEVVAWTRCHSPVWHRPGGSPRRGCWVRGTDQWPDAGPLVTTVTMIMVAAATMTATSARGFPAGRQEILADPA